MREKKHTVTIRRRKFTVNHHRGGDGGVAGSVGGVAGIGAVVGGGVETLDREHGGVLVYPDGFQVFRGVVRY